MLEIIAIIAVIIAIAIAVGAHLRRDQTEYATGAARSQHQGAGGQDLSADQRFSPMAQLVALREQGSRHEAHL